MTTIIRSGTKVTIFADNAILRAIATILRVPIQVGNAFVKTSVSIPAKKLPVVKDILGE